MSDELVRALRARTPARVLVGRAGPAYRTATQLALRHDHAAALDAVWAEVDLERDLGPELVRRFGLFEVTTRAADKEQYLLRPDLGRQLSDPGRALVQARCPRGMDLQVAIGDGLSAAAITAQVPALLPLPEEAAPGIAALAEQMRRLKLSGVGVKEERPALPGLGEQA